MSDLKGDSKEDVKENLTVSNENSIIQTQFG